MNMLRTLQSSSFLLLAGAALVCGDASVAASPDPPQRVVRYDDLDLNKKAGVRTLYRRLATAAKTVCAPNISVPVTLRNRSRNCARETLADAVAQVNHPNLTAYYIAKTDASQGRDTKVVARR